MHAKPTLAATAPLSQERQEALWALRTQHKHSREVERVLIQQARQLRREIKKLEKMPECIFVKKALGVGSNWLSYHFEGVGPVAHFEEWKWGSKKNMAVQCAITPYGFRVIRDSEFAFNHRDRYEVELKRMWLNSMMHLVRAGVSAADVSSAIKTLAADLAREAEPDRAD
jgi:hypothetical protein